MITVNNYTVIAQRGGQAFLLVSQDREQGFVIIPENDYLGPVMHPESILSRGCWDEIIEADEKDIDVERLKAVYEKHQSSQKKRTPSPHN